MTSGPAQRGEEGGRGDARITHAMEDYLKAVFHLQSDDGAVSTQALAEELGVAPASATNMVKRLHELRLVEHAPYRGVRLTESGTRVALEVVRHHRLLELYLAETLGYGWDEVHDEAERLEHLVSDELEARMDRVLGFPRRDPHGDPIPTAEGDIEVDDAVCLADLGDGAAGEVVRVSDRDPERLRRIGSLGLRPGASVSMIDASGRDSALRVAVDGVERRVDAEAAEAVVVRLATNADDA